MARIWRDAALGSGLASVLLLAPPASRAEHGAAAAPPDASAARAAASSGEDHPERPGRAITEWWLGQRANPDASSGDGAGVEVVDTRPGDGRVAASGNRVSIHYTAKVLDGPTFDKTTPASPLTFQLGSDQVIRGLSLGIPGMKVGGTRRITIPPALGFGSRPPRGVPPGATLVYTVSLVEVSGPSAAPAAGPAEGGTRGKEETKERTASGRERGSLTAAPTRWAQDYTAARMVSALTKDPIVCLVARIADWQPLDIGGETWLPLSKKAVLVWLDPAPAIIDDRNEHNPELVKQLGVTGPLPQVVVARAPADSSQPDEVLCRIQGGTSPADWVSKIEACLARAR